MASSLKADPGRDVGQRSRRGQRTDCGDTTKADAIAINEAMAGVGTDEKGINAIYSRIRDEVEADAKHKGMNDCRGKRRDPAAYQRSKERLGAKYAGGDPNQMGSRLPRRAVRRRAEPGSGRAG